MKTLKIICLYFVFVACVGCNQLFVDENPNDTPVNNFKLLWTQIDENYPYFQEKGVDWDAMYDKYYPLVSDKMDDEALFAVMDKMLGELRDGHVNLMTPFNTGRYHDWYQDYPQNFNFSIVDSSYLKKDFVLTSGIYAQILDNNIGYMYYPSFSVNITDDGMDYLLNTKFKDCKGIILDIRNNGGGFDDNIYKLGSYIVSEKTLVGYLRFKSGKGHDDFSKYYEEHFDVHKKKLAFNKEVVILVNRSSYSATNIFAGMAKGLPHITVMGDYTGGGSASPILINLINGWSVRISRMLFADKDKKTFEFGVAPDIFINLAIEDEIKGRDTIIEAAIEYLKNK